MIRGYAFYGEKQSEVLESVERAVELWRDQAGVIWLDMQGEERTVVEEVGRAFSLETVAIEDSLAGEPRPRIDEYDDHLFFLLYGALGLDEPPRFSPRKISLFLGQRFVITVHQEPHRTVEGVHARYRRHTAKMLREGLDLLMYNLIDGIVDNYVLCAEAYEDRLGKLEDESLLESTGPALLAVLSDIRNDLVALRRLVVSVREITTPIGHGAYDHFSEELELPFNHVWSHLTQSLELLEGLLDTVHVVRDNYHSVLTQKTNALMGRLTTFATFLLPMSLIAGIFGMNLDVGLDPQSPWSAVKVFGLMGAVSLGIYLAMRWRKL